MFIIHGTYHWKRRKTAYRNDACLRCKMFTISEQYRMFDVGHLFGIPLLPLGFRQRWYCADCRNEPHKTDGPKRSFQKVLEAVPPFIDDLCIYCREPLTGGEVKYCPACRVERYEQAPRSQASAA